MRARSSISLFAIVAAGGLLALGNVNPAGEPAHAATPGTRSAGLAVVELFTSQGCSSCPPADALAGRLAREPGVLVISRPVTYWDRLGWKDTLAQPANTELQQAYAANGIPGGGVYTPQIVIDGSAGVVGSRESEVRTLIRASKPDATIAFAKTGPDRLSARITGAEPDARLSLMALDSSALVNIGRGENGGRKIAYTNVLKREIALGTVTGDTDIDLPARDVSGADRYALILRRGTSGPILAARLLPTG